MEPVLSVEDVFFRYGEAWVLQGITFPVRRGEILGILGPNASGKTTLLRVLDGILRPQRGRVLLHGEELRRMGRRQVARRVAVVPQESPLLYPFTAMEVVLMGRNPHLSALSFEGPEDRDLARKSLERTGCKELAERNVNELSGGERQRVLIARALAQEPEVLLLDEPTAYLDLGHQMDFVELLIRLHREEHLTVVWVSHDLNLASLAAHRILLLKGGTARALGSPSEVITRERIREVYGRDVVVDRNPWSDTPRITPVIPSSHELGEGGP